MHHRYSIALGLVALAGFGLTTLLHVGEVPVHFYLPDTPAVEALDRALTHTTAPTVEPSGMRLEIPKIGVDASIEDLSTQDGQLETPAQWQDAGWYDMTPKPGEPGAAVLVGHVDSHTGPAVFYRLHELRPGDPILVSAAGRSFSYVVAGSNSYPETSPKLSEVFSASQAGSSLALLTCSGDFNRATQRYNQRLVVTAVAS